MVQLAIGALIAILITIAVENLRRPKLALSAEQPPYDSKYSNAPAVNMRSLRVRLSNTQLPKWAGWMMRSPALQCRATITFQHLDSQDVFGRTMAGRWAGSPQPVPLPIVGPHGEQSRLYDLGRLTSESRIDIYPGESELLDIAVRLDDDVECYGWNNDSYFCDPLWRNSAWKLDKGRYLVKVSVTSSGQKCAGTFRLINDVGRTDCRLE